MRMLLPIWSRFLVPLISIGTAHAQDLPPENVPVVERQVAEVNSSDPIWTARAQYLPPPNAAEGPIFIQPSHVSGTSSFDANSLGNRNAYIDGTFAPFSGIYESGLRLRLTGTASWYQFVTSEDPRTLGSGRYLEGALLVGYGVWLPRFSFTWLVGPAFGEGVNEGVIKDQWGAKAVIEMNARPTDLTMASGSVTYSTIGNNLKVQAKTGLKIYRDIYVGPEAKFTWQQILPWQVNFSSSAFSTTTPVSPQAAVASMHLGAHVSALSVGPVLIGVSGGWAHDRQLGSGYYGGVTLYQPF